MNKNKTGTSWIYDIFEDENGLYTEGWKTYDKEVLDINTSKLH